MFYSWYNVLPFYALFSHIDVLRHVFFLQWTKYSTMCLLMATIHTKQTSAISCKVGVVVCVRFLLTNAVKPSCIVNDV